MVHQCLEKLSLKHASFQTQIFFGVELLRHYNLDASCQHIDGAYPTTLFTPTRLQVARIRAMYCCFDPSKIPDNFVCPNILNEVTPGWRMSSTQMA